jgi:malate dehydrogenase (oxaloacetate-decarboxylating)(NADP+)
MMIDKAKQCPKKVAFPDASEFNVLKAAYIAQQEGMATPVLIGNEEKIRRLIAENELEFNGVEIIDNRSRAQDQLRRHYADRLFEKRSRKGMTHEEAVDKMFDKNYFAAMMLECGDVDAALTGYSTRYPDAIEPVLEVIGKKPEVAKIFGMHIIITPKGTFFLADTSMGASPDSETLVDTALQSAGVVRHFNIEPHIAMLSYSNFGASKKGTPTIVRKAVEILHNKHPEIIVDGEMQLKTALDKELRNKIYPFNKLGDKDVNTFIFPNLSSANIAMHILHHIGDYETLGPVLVGNRKSMHVMQMQCSVRDVLNMIAISVIDAQTLSK